MPNTTAHALTVNPIPPSPGPTMAIGGETSVFPEAQSIHHSSYPDRCKAVVFAIAHYWFAVPAAAILKVIRWDDTRATEMAQSGFMMLNGRPFAIVDLRSRLLVSDPHSHLPNLAQLPAAPIATDSFVPCLVAMQPIAGETWALRVDHPPTLLELPLTEVYPISSITPRSIRAIAQHMVVLTLPASGSSVNRPIFLMNLADVPRGLQTA